MSKLNMGRVWALLEQVVPADEYGQAMGTLVGMNVGGPNPVARWNAFVDGPDRDVLLVSPLRLVVLSPRPAAKLGLRDAWKASRGNVSSLADVVSIPRERVRGYVHDFLAPPSLPATAGETFVHFDLVDDGGVAGRLDFWVDVAVKKVGGLDDTMSRWIPRPT